MVKVQRNSSNVFTVEEQQGFWDLTKIHQAFDVEGEVTLRITPTWGGQLRVTINGNGEMIAVRNDHAEYLSVFTVDPNEPILTAWSLPIEESLVYR